MDIDKLWDEQLGLLSSSFGVIINCCCVKCNNSINHPKHKGPQCYHLSCWLSTIGKKYIHD